MYYSDINIGGTLQRRLIAKYVPKNGTSLSSYIEERVERKKEQINIDLEDKLERFKNEIKFIKKSIKVLMSHPEANKVKIEKFKEQLEKINKEIYG